MVFIPWKTEASIQRWRTAHYSMHGHPVGIQLAIGLHLCLVYPPRFCSTIDGFIPMCQRYQTEASVGH